MSSRPYWPVMWMEAGLGHRTAATAQGLEKTQCPRAVGLAAGPPAWGLSFPSVNGGVLRVRKVKTNY